MKTFTASLLFIALAAGCSSSDDPKAPGTTPPIDTPDGGTVTPIDTTTKMTPPQGVWTKPTNAAHYKVYASRDEAIAWFDEARTRDPSVAADKPVAGSDPRYAALDTEVAAIWKGFEKVFARDTEGVPAPIVVLVESSAPGAYAVFDGKLGLSPNVFMIQAPTLTAVNAVGLRGVIAHELAHHVLKHKWPNVSDKIEHWYDPAKTTGQGFGYEQADNATLRATGVKYVVFASTTGDYPAKEWNGFNRPEGNIEYYRQLIHDQAKAKTAAPCTDAETARNTLLTLGDPLRSRVTGTFKATPEQTTQLDAASKAYVEKETACASALPGKLFDIIAADAALTEPEVRKQASPAEITANDAATNSYDAIVRLTKAYDEFLLSVDPKTIKYYSFEEQADDVSASVLLAIGFDPKGLATFVHDGLLDAAAKTECDGLVAAGEPPFGVLGDPHHANCWRIWHQGKLVDYLTAASGGP